MLKKLGKKQKEGMQEIAEELTPPEIKKGAKLTRSLYKVATNKNPPI